MELPMAKCVQRRSTFGTNLERFWLVLIFKRYHIIILKLKFGIINYMWQNLGCQRKLSKTTSDRHVEDCYLSCRSAVGV